jgi:biotin carboxylase
MPRMLILMSTRTYRAEAFMKAASGLGLEVTVGTEREQVLAPLTPGATVALDFEQPAVAVRQIVEFDRQYPLSAVVGVDDDVTVLAALAAETLGLRGNSAESVKAARYKDLFRLILAESGLNAPAFRLVETDQDPEEIAPRVTYPCVIKPLALSASRGVVRANDPEQFVAAFREVVEIIGEADLARDDPASHQLLVEDFIPGVEVALEGLLDAGRLTVLALFDKPDPLDGPYFEETIYVTPSRLSDEQQAAISVTTAKAAAAIGLREGPIHAELRVNDRGVWLIEVAARSIGGLCSNSLRFGLNLSLEEIILRHAAGLEIASLAREQQPAGVMMIPIPAGGILCGVTGLPEARAVAGVESVTISIPIGRPVVPLPRGTQYLGFIVARGASAAAVEAILRQSHDCLSFDIRPPA